MERLIVILILFKFVINTDEQLVVTGADEPVCAQAGEDVTLSCSLDTHVNVTELQVEWRKTDDDGDILVLLYADGENRPESQDERYTRRAEFFTDEIPKGNFSMKLWKVRMEDKGEFRCEVHLDTDSANTTARIIALGYSSLHWLILGLCIAVTPVVLLTGAFSVWSCIRKGKSRQALLCHWSCVTVPQIMVSAAFILWGVTEGSAGEAATCTVISLLIIPLLYIMVPYVDSTEAIGEMKYVTVSVGNIFVITAVCAGSLIEFSAKFSPTSTDKALFGGVLGGIIFVFIFFVIVRIVRFALQGNDTSMEIRGTLAKITGIIILFIMVSSISVVSVFLAKSHSARKEQLGTFLTMLMIPILMILFPVGVSVFWILHSRRTAGRLELKDILKIWAYFIYNRKLFNMLLLAIYSQLFAWMQNTFILDLAQKILLGIFFLLHLILGFQYLSVIIENDRGRPIKMCEYVFINILTLTSCFQDWKREKFLAKQRKFLYFSGAFGLPLLNSVALAVALKLKADTGKQPVDLRLIVLISGSVFLFSWFVIQMSAYWSDKKIQIKQEFAHFQRPKDPEPDQGSCENQEMEASSPADHNEPSAEEVLLGEKNTEV
ncbi:uncharacterized protein [Paramormyrops kingsleyae]|uniref:uncharacterized protein isoform X2 n=1 Tax=Paramormyrops kingsleyae TaxID=1676925 RepID=UPI003B971B66